MLDTGRMTWPEHGDDVLSVNGVFFERILACSDIMSQDDSEEHLEGMAREVITKALAEDPRFRVISEVYWQVALGDILEGNYADPNEHLEGVMGDEYWRNEMLRDQRLFITENGAVGLGPSGTSVGDEVWVLSGGRSPFLLGPLHKSDADVKGEDWPYHYTFRGDVFIPGIMNGEAVDSRIDTQRFVHIH
ncbi:hypothetical protein NPX13_g8807 [Xylaria arbuscula]|uniref:Uncharacterized protein n=1 Tax=Xylaria arbuscula TaxID=114810 RepID=A0A9W8N880_9PEZI|nr:hypothetical protein NPX13_g8807 [Xylaria arbuscula]